MPAELPTGTVTLLFTDIEGSTRMLQELGREAYVRALTEHRRLLREAFTAHGGVEVEMQGDSFHFAFPYARDALAAAVAGQRALAEHAWESQPIRVRIGLHTGEPMQADDLYAGLDVHRAARVMSAAHGGQVVLSARTAELVDGELPTGVALVDLGQHGLKDFTAPQRLYQAGEGVFPPLKTLHRSNLPVPATSFVGRERELGQVGALLLEDEVRLLSLTGPGGTGKTRIAIQAARNVSQSFPDGVHWVGLAALRDPGLVVETIAEALAAKGDLSEHVGTQRLLILLDNFEQVISAAPAVSGLLARCPGLKLLVTSRQTLSVQAEVEFAVPPLIEADAVTLFCARSQLDPTADIGTLCRRLDSLPLAVELAAARTSVLSPAQILDRLSQRLDLLKGARDADPRQQTLRATIDWSYSLLSPAEQDLFRRLSVFAGGCTLEAAEAVADADIDTLQSLVEKNLVRFSNERFWLLEAIREYAAEQLADSASAGESKVRHADWFSTLLEQAEPELEGPAQEVWLERLYQEHDNIRAALRWALDEDDAERALRMAGASATFWWVHGHWTEGRRWCEEALASTRPASLALRAKTLEGAAHLAYRQQDYARAKTLSEEGLVACDELADGSRTARMLRVRGLVAVGEGDDDQFLALVERSAAHARESGDRWALMMALNNLGYLALQSGETRQATQFFEEALQAARVQGDQRTESYVLENLALAKLQSGMIKSAGDDFAESLGMAQRLGFVEIAAENLVGIAAVATARGCFEDAARLLGGAQRLRDEIGAALDPLEALMAAQTSQELQRNLEPEEYSKARQAGAGLQLDELAAIALACIA